MKKEDKNSLRIGGTTFPHVPHFASWDYERFVSTYKDVKGFDVFASWQAIQKRLKELGITEKVTKAKREKMEKELNEKKEQGIDTGLFP